MTLELIIKSDRVLNQLNNAPYDFKKLENQVAIRIAISRIAFARYLDYTYPTKTI